MRRRLDDSVADKRRNPLIKTGFEVTIVTAAGDTVKRVDGELLTVGRAEGSNLVIAHETLSRRHLTLRRQGEDLFVEDHGSSNGTFVNGKRIKKNAPVPVKADDLITMGEATVRLRAAIPEVRAETASAPVIATSTAKEFEQTMTGTFEPTATATTGPSPLLAKTAEPKPVEPKPVEPKAADPAVAELKLAAERAFAEAQRQATLIITQAEVEADKRAQDILRRAHEAEAKMDEQYQKRMNDAYRGSEQLSQDAQRDSRELIETARHQSNEIRTQAETYVSDLRARTKLECERALEEAHQTARALKDSKMDELVETERARREEAQAKLKAELDALETRVRKQVSDEEARRRADMDGLMKLANEEHEALRAEIESLAQMKTSERGALDVVRADLARDRAETNELEARRARASAELKALEADVQRLSVARAENETKVREAQGALHTLNEDLRQAGERLTQAQTDGETQAHALKTKFEAERTRAEEAEALHLQNVKLETTRRARALELQMMDELAEKRDALARELYLNVDAFLKKTGATNLDVAELEGEVRAVFDRQVTAIAEDDSMKRAQANLTSIKRQQKWTTGLVGATLGAVAVYGGLYLQAVLSGELSPMQRRLAAAQEAKAKDLEERKFNPDLSPGYKATYFDNVVHGLNFVDVYTSDDFQNRLRKDMMPYMLRVWRLDENKVIEALSISNALVKGLAEKRKLVNPDTLQKNLDGMKDSEAEAQKRLRDTLGSQVRLESYLKFEREFYDKYQP